LAFRREDFKVLFVAFIAPIACAWEVCVENWNPRVVGVEFHVRLCRDAVGRDFTMNSLVLDPIKGRILDFNYGLRDLRSFRLAAAAMPISTLSADPIRCIRCAHFL
jgi:tRNA nucleotidyltransferase/poly(A) polymerase